MRQKDVATPAKRGSLEREALEASVRAKCEAGDLEGAATDVLVGYGPEILGMLHALTRHEDDARDAFSRFSEDLWKGIGRFEWRASMRTWAYSLARNATIRMQRAPHRRVGRNLAVTDHEGLSVLVAQVRDRTMPFLRTEVKSELALLREALEPDDQLLLILRVDKQMNWDDIARITLEEDGATPEDAGARKRRAALLRKRFQNLKDRLREQARERGLLDDAT